MRAICSALKVSPPAVDKLVQGVTVNRDRFRECCATREGIRGFSSVVDITLEVISVLIEGKDDNELPELEEELLSDKMLVVVVVEVVSVSAVTWAATWCNVLAASTTGVTEKREGRRPRLGTSGGTGTRLEGDTEVRVVLTVVVLDAVLFDAQSVFDDGCSEAVVEGLSGVAEVLGTLLLASGSGELEIAAAAAVA